jgi:DNA repair protein RecO (recombination protein O)
MTVEPLETRAAAIMGSGLALHGINLMGALLRLLPERDPHPALYETAQIIAAHLDDETAAPALMVRLEMAVLAELGFGLDLSQCAASGVREDLIYVSPKSGRAVSREAGEPWKDRLLALPGFLTGAQGSAPNMDEIEAGFALTGYFLERDVYLPRNLEVPPARRAFIGELTRQR